MSGKCTKTKKASGASLRATWYHLSLVCAVCNYTQYIEIQHACDIIFIHTFVSELNVYLPVYLLNKGGSSLREPL